MSEPLMNAEKLRQVTDAVRDAWNHWNTHEYRRDLLYDLLNDYTRLRTLPPEVAAAMERYARHIESENCAASSPYFAAHGFDDLQRLTDVLAIAAHFTTLFQKGA